MRNKLKTPLLDSLEIKEQSNLNKIATESHLRNRLSNNYDFLQLTPGNINTYKLGFISGAMYITTQELEKIKKEHEEMLAPTIHRYTNLSQLGEQC